MSEKVTALLTPTWLDQTLFIKLTKISMTVLNVESDTATPIIKVLYWEKCCWENVTKLVWKSKI